MRNVSFQKRLQEEASVGVESEIIAKGTSSHHGYYCIFFALLAELFVSLLDVGICLGFLLMANGHWATHLRPLSICWSASFSVYVVHHELFPFFKECRKLWNTYDMHPCLSGPCCAQYLIFMVRVIFKAAYRFSRSVAVVYIVFTYTSCLQKMVDQMSTPTALMDLYLSDHLLIRQPITHFTADVCALVVIAFPFLVDAFPVVLNCLFTPLKTAISMCVANCMLCIMFSVEREAMKQAKPPLSEDHQDSIQYGSYQRKFNANHTPINASGENFGSDSSYSFSFSPSHTNAEKATNPYSTNRANIDEYLHYYHPQIQQTFLNRHPMYLSNPLLSLFLLALRRYYRDDAVLLFHHLFRLLPIFVFFWYLVYLFHFIYTSMKCATKTYSCFECCSKTKKEERELRDMESEFLESISHADENEVCMKENEFSPTTFFTQRAQTFVHIDLFRLVFFSICSGLLVYFRQTNMTVTFHLFFLLIACDKLLLLVARCFSELTVFSMLSGDVDN